MNGGLGTLEDGVGAHGEEVETLGWTLRWNKNVMQGIGDYEIKLLKNESL